MRKNLTELVSRMSLVLTLLVMALALGWLTPVSSMAGIDDRWCVGENDELCITKDGNMKATRPVIAKATALTGVTASTTIAFTSAYWIVTSSGGVVPMVATPAISTAATSGVNITSGQTMIIRGTSDANAIVLQDDDSVAGTLLELGATTRTLGLNDIIYLLFDATSGRWLEVSYSNLN